MMRMLRSVAFTAALSYAAACVPSVSIEPMTEPRTRDERIEWRSSLGIQAAHAFVFDDCTPTESLESALSRFGEPFGLSSRDVAESIVWGVFHYREDLPSSNAQTVHSYLDEQIDQYGERFIAITQILFGTGPYARTIQWYLYDPIRHTIGAEDPESLRSNITRGLAIARYFIDTDSEYERMRSSWLY